MIGAIHSALSGLTAFSRQIEVTAHNVANVMTDGFKKSRTEFVSVETGGVLLSFEKMTLPVLPSCAIAAMVQSRQNCRTSISVRKLSIKSSVSEGSKPTSKP